MDENVEIKRMKAEEKKLFEEVLEAVKQKRVDPYKVKFEFPTGLVSSSKQDQIRIFAHNINQFRKILAKTV